jgi:putative flippase GtrA
VREGAGSLGSVDADEVADRIISRTLALLPGPLERWYATADGRKKIRYALVSVVAVPIGTVAVAVFNVAGLTAGWAAVCGNSVGAVPSYLLNRYWVWGKTGTNHLFSEILPFWVITLIGIALSLVVAHEAGRITREHGIGGALRILILLVANVAGFGVLWVAKYILFNKMLFVVRHHEVAPATTDTELG